MISNVVIFHWSIFIFKISNKVKLRKWFINYFLQSCYFDSLCYYYWPIFSQCSSLKIFVFLTIINDEKQGPHDRLSKSYISRENCLLLCHSLWAPKYSGDRDILYPRYLDMSKDFTEAHLLLISLKIIEFINYSGHVNRRCFKFRIWACVWHSVNDRNLETG